MKRFIPNRTITFTPYKPADNTGKSRVRAPENLYYFHPNHLGTGTLITNGGGEPYQYFVNLPYGETLYEKSQNFDYDNPYKFNGKELDQETGLYYYGARYYDPETSIFLSIDPLVEKYANLNPYTYTFSNPVRFMDPTGMEGEDWIEINGQMIYDNRVTNQDDATALYGVGAIYRPNGYTYTSSDGSEIELGDYGFLKVDGVIKSSPDYAKYSLAYTNPSQAQTNADKDILAVKVAFAFAITIRTGQAADVATPDPSDALIWKWIGHGLLYLGTAYYIAKMEKEIEGIKRRAGGPQGYMYSLNANITGAYPVMTWGYASPTSTTILNAGDVWKYGETSSRSDRYSQTSLSRIGAGGVTQIPLFYGNQVQIKVAEKMAIYSYFLKNGHLPPGNKIFR